MTQIYIIHENDAWTAPLERELKALQLPFQSWFLDRGHFDLSSVPPDGVFYNRMSASSHTRDHRYAHEYTSAVIAWLEQHGRRVLNGSRANQLEVTKVGQYAALARYGIRTPRTIPAVGREHILAAAKNFDGPFITKHNRAGKGLGVHLFRSIPGLESYLDGDEYESPVDGITLIQQYIEAPEPFITRVEFVGQRYLYAVRVDTSEGFQLCPADACAIGEGANCPATPRGLEPRPKFEIIQGFESDLIPKYQQFMRDHDFAIAAFEFIVDAEGRRYTYDVNQNTNYNSAAEGAVGVSGMGSIARYLGEELASLLNERNVAA